MANITLNLNEFRAEFPAFPECEKYTNQDIEIYFASACCYISPENYGWMQGECRRKALYLMTAHLAALNALILSGKVPQIVQSSTVDRVSVTLVPPPVSDKSQWQWWLSLTPYGGQLLAMLQAQSVGGFYVGGLPESAAFRRVGGIVR